MATRGWFARRWPLAGSVPAYRIHVVDETAIVDDEGRRQGLVSRQATPWPSCGRETKMRAVEKLPELLDMIIQETERLAETADDTASKIGAMIGTPRWPYRTRKWHRSS